MYPVNDQIYNKYPTDYVSSVLVFDNFFFDV